MASQGVHPWLMLLLGRFYVPFALLRMIELDGSISNVVEAK